MHLKGWRLATNQPRAFVRTGLDNATSVDPHVAYQQLTWINEILYRL
jgi:hypothetical protein